jgi:hypothetical protein
MSSVYTKEALSGSTHGRGILVVATATPGTTIHTASTGTTSAAEDVIALFAYNSHSSGVVLTVQWGGTTSPDDEIVQLIPSQSGLTLVVADLILRNTLIVKAFAAITNKITIHGYANRIA